MRVILALILVLFYSCGPQRKNTTRTGKHPTIPTQPVSPPVITPAVEDQKEKCEKTIFVIWNNYQCKSMDEYKRLFPKSINIAGIDNEKLSDLYKKYLRSYLFLEEIGYRQIIVAQKLIIKDLDTSGELTSYLDNEGETLIIDPEYFNAKEFENQLLSHPFYLPSIKGHLQTEGKATLIHLEIVKDLILKAYETVVPNNDLLYFKVTLKPQENVLNMRRVSNTIEVTVDMNRVNAEDFVDIFRKLNNGEF